MKRCSESVMLLKLIYITSLPAVLEADHYSSVIGHVGDDVTLPCRFTKQPNTNVTQVQWDFSISHEHVKRILVFNPLFGVNKSESLKDRLDIDEQSLIIRNVEKEDAGLYTCKIAAFPTGSFESKSNLVVREQTELSPGLIFAVLAALLLLGILAAVAYVLFRCGSSVRSHVNADAGGAMADAAMQPGVARCEDVIYSQVKRQSSIDTTTSHNPKETKTENDAGDDVTYSEVFRWRQQPQEEDDSLDYIQVDYDII